MAEKNKLIESIETNLLSLYPEPNRPKKKVEEEMDYPGQIKVVVIREVRKIGYAK